MAKTDATMSEIHYKVQEKEENIKLLVKAKWKVQHYSKWHVKIISVSEYVEKYVKIGIKK